MLAWDERRNVEEEDPVEVSRPLLIFNHNPKAGGGSILKVLRGFKSRETLCKRVTKRPGDEETFGSSCAGNAWKEAFSEENGGVDTAFFHFGEFARTTRFDRLHGFVIGSIREPCSQYLSLWSFGSTGEGTFRKKINNPDLYGVSAPYFNTTSDKKRFLAWMKHPMVAGRVGNRVKESYGESVLDTVDCWVFVEDFQNSLLNCLQMYEDQGGFIDWEAPTVAGLLEQRSKTNERGHHKLAANKNNPLGDPRSSHHGKCEDMFDNETAKHVEETTEPFVYDLFGYKGCCKPGTNFHPREDNNIPINFGEEANFTTNNTKSFHSNNVENMSTFNHTNSTPRISNSQKTWLSSPPTSQSYNDDRTMNSVVAAATITGILLLTFYRFLRI